MRNFCFNIFVFFLLLFTTMSCRKHVEFKTVGHKNYNIKIPIDLKSVRGLNKNAELQFGNLDNNLSVIVIRDEIDAVKKTAEIFFEQNTDIDSAQRVFALSFDGYCDMVIYTLKEKSSNFKIMLNSDTIINSIPAKIYTYSGDFNNNTSYCKLAIYAGKNDYYQVFSFSSPENYSQYSHVMMQIVSSLSE